MLVTLSLYVMRELGKALGLSLLVFGFVLFGVFGWQIIRHGASIFTVIMVVPQLFPFISPTLLPLTIITGTIICFGRMSSGNEFVAVQAGGIHRIWIAVPALVVAILAATITVFLNANVLTAATASIEKSLVRDQAAILERKLHQSGSILLENTVICRLQGEGGREGIDITSFGRATDKEKKNRAENSPWDLEYPYPTERIIAKDHRISLEEVNGRMYVRTELKQSYRFNPMSRGHDDVIKAESAILRMPAMAEGSDPFISRNRLSNMGIGEILRLRKTAGEEIRQLGSSLFAAANFKDLSGFCTRVAEAAEAAIPSPGRRLWDTVPKKVRSLIEAVSQGDMPAEKAAPELAEALNVLLGNPKFYEREYFQGMPLSPEVKRLLKLKREYDVRGRTLPGGRRARLNRLLLEAAFPEAIPPHKSLNRQASLARIRTRARAEGKPAWYVGAAAGLTKSYYKRVAELHLKLALSFSCIAFAVVGIPLGLLRRRGSKTVGFVYGLLVALAFYLVIKALQGQVKADRFAWWAMWMPNLVMILLGTVLWFRCERAD